MKRLIYLLGFLAVIFTTYSLTNITGDGPKVGDQAPEMVLNDPEGNPIALSSLKGKLVLIDFWASWCFPCRNENPNIVRLYHKYKSSTFKEADGFTVYSVSLDKARGTWIRAIEKDQLVWNTHVSDLGGWGSKAASNYGVTKIPTTFLIDHNGVIIAKDMRVEELEKKLDEMLVQ